MLSPETHADRSADPHVQLPAHTHVNSDRDAIAEVSSDAATGGERALVRAERSSRKGLVRPEEAGADDEERNDLARTIACRSGDVPRHISSEHEVTVVLSTDVADFGP